MPHEQKLFLEVVSVGDLIEFDRGIYSHWAVYVGLQDHDGREVHCVVHRSNNELESVSHVSAKGKNRIGEVDLEPLEDVWNMSLVRLNNSKDADHPPLDAEQVVARALASYDKRTGISREPYNLGKNNCEHFATWTRNGTAQSDQVVNTAIGVGVGVGVGVVGVIAAVGVILGTQVNRTNRNQYDTRKQEN